MIPAVVVAAAVVVLLLLPPLLASLLEDACSRLVVAVAVAVVRLKSVCGKTPPLVVTRTS